MNAYDALKGLVTSLNDRGIPIPLIRVNGHATLTGTMALVSFGTCLFGQVGKLAGFLGGIDLTQANYLFGICLAAYLGRRMTSNAQTKTIEMAPKEEDPS